MDRQPAVLFVIFAACLALLPSGTPSAQSRAIKLATVVPAGSIWDTTLKQMGTEWETATEGRVALTVFSGGSQGDEATVLRKMRLDALQAASLTVVGLASIDASFNVFNIPFFFESYDELNHVVDKLTPTLKKKLESKDFVMLNWGHGGWLQLFTKQPIKTLDDLKKLKLYTSAGDDRMTQWYKSHGFQPRAMAMTDILPGLSTGMIDALPTTPLAAMAFQWDRQTKYMLDIGLSPVVGATVVTERAWNRIAAADRQKLMEAAAVVQKKLQADVPKQDLGAVLVMTQRGLSMTKASGSEWRAEAETLATTMRGEMVPRDIYDLATKERNAFRQLKVKG
jgi:TRAP-type C4-dicarboxylate transport system substrate-binding protein